MARPKKFSHSACSKCGTPRSIVNPLWLRHVRVEAELPLREVARRLEYSAPYISDIEHGRRACLPKVRKFYEGIVLGGDVDG